MATLLVSDIHLGSHLSRVRELLALLKRTAFDRIILLGDIFSDFNFARLTELHLRFLNYLRRLAKRGIEVVWIEGNHDSGLIAFLSRMFGIRAYEEYRWEWRGKSCLAIHGHQFDAIISRSKWFPKLVSFLYLEAQKIPFFRRNLSLLLDTVSTKWQRLTQVVAKKALRYAKAKGADIVFCGHTHQAHWRDLDGVEYFNTGCWVGNTCTYILQTDERNRVEFFTFASEPASGC